MCGVFGAVGALPADEAVFEGMARRLAHRGPDGVARWRAPRAMLGLVRLAIVGVDEAPRVHAAGAARAVMNGEVYGHARLRRGLGLESHSDAAVVPALYARHGVAFVERLDGPFAIALYDEGSRTLHLWRDRLGKKPLFFRQVGRALYFASEQKALLHLPGAPPRLDATAAARFLRRGTLDDGEGLFEGVEAVAPGERVTVDARGRLTRHRWWSLAEVAQRRAVAGVEARLGPLLEDAVRRRVPSEVRGGLLLSGGLDSALLGAALGPGAVPAFTMESDDRGDVRAARAVARHLGLAVTPVALRPPSEATLREALWHLEQPDAFAAWGIASAALQLGRQLRGAGVRVALMGEGADEVFLGYAWDGLQAALERGDAALPADAVRLLGPRAVRFALQHALARLTTPWPRARDVWMAVASGGVGAFVEPRLEGWLLQRPAPEDAAAARGAAPGGAGPRGRQLAGLGHDMLTLPVLHADRLFMASGVEARLPFLDHRLVELALRTPPRLLEVAGTDKPLLRRLAGRWLPGWRPPAKRGFSAAAAPEVGELHRLAAALAGGEPRAVRPEVWRAARGWRDPVRAHALWRLVVLETTARVLLEGPGGRTPPAGR